MVRTPFCFIVCALVSATNLVAQLSPPNQQWGDTAVRYLMTKQEKTDWASVKTDAEAKAFIELFWARRDPTPDTPPNELRQLIETRIVEADKRFTTMRTAGAQSDRGVVYELLGEPTQITSRAVAPPRSTSTLRQFARPINIETWIYRNEAASHATGTKAFDIGFVFQDEKYGGEFELDGQSRLSFDSTALAMAKSALKRPYLTAADLAPGAGRMVALRMIVVSDASLASDILRRAQAGENSADLARRYSSHPSARQGGYLGRIAFVQLGDDIKAALAGKEPGAAVLITRLPQYAVIKLLTEAEATAAEAEVGARK